MDNLRKSMKQSWVERCIATNNFHAEQIIEHPDWRIEDTVRELGRSVGSVSADLKVARFLRDEKYSAKLKSLRYFTHALEICKEIELGRKVNLI